MEGSPNAQSGLRPPGGATRSLSSPSACSHLPLHRRSLPSPWPCSLTAAASILPNPCYITAPAKETALTFPILLVHLSLTLPELSLCRRGSEKVQGMQFTSAAFFSSEMAKRFFCGPSLLLVFAFFSALPSSAAAPVAKDGVSCTMCASCDNPCHHFLSPPPSVPSLPPPSTPTQGTYYYFPPPPPLAGAGSYYLPPPFKDYPGPPPPHPIMPYFPYYFYSPPPPSKTFATSGSSLLRAPFASKLQLFLLFLPFLLLFGRWSSAT